MATDTIPEPDGPNYYDAQWLREQFEAGKTSAEIAEACGVSPDTIRKWARDKHGFDPELYRSAPGADGGDRRYSSIGIRRDPGGDLKGVAELRTEKDELGLTWTEFVNAQASALRRHQEVDVAELAAEIADALGESLVVEGGEGVDMEQVANAARRGASEAIQEAQR